jgi:hypothetical protein
MHGAGQDAHRLWGGHFLHCQGIVQVTQNNITPNLHNTCGKQFVTLHGAAQEAYNASDGMHDKHYMPEQACHDLQGALREVL